MLKIRRDLEVLRNKFPNFYTTWSLEVQMADKMVHVTVGI
jgi:hypothetical protein